MNIFGTDPKDEIITLLNGIIEGLRADNDALRKQNMALTDRAAFALAYPRATVAVPSKPAEPSPMDLRDVPLKPALSRSQVEDTFRLKSA